jgi:pimeloyl-ACP methyl ester carboxylesterase
VLSVAAHEPPLLGAVRSGTVLARLVDDVQRWVVDVRDDLANGRPDAGARRFFDQVLGEGAWDLLPAAVRNAVTADAPTFAAMLDDPGWDRVTTAPDTATPTLLTKGTDSPPWLSGIVDELADTHYRHARRESIEGAGHAPHLTHPASYVALVQAFTRQAELPRPDRR